MTVIPPALKGCDSPLPIRSTDSIFPRRLVTGLSFIDGSPEPVDGAETGHRIQPVFMKEFKELLQLRLGDLLVLIYVSPCQG